MGRAIHTNFAAAFSCDSIKAAMIKNAWVAGKLNLNLYDVVFRFERPGIEKQSIVASEDKRE